MTPGVALTVRVARAVVSGAVALTALLFLAPAHAAAQDDAERFQSGRFTILAYPGDATLARSLLARALARDTFPGLPRPSAAVTIALAPDDTRFREWTGSGFPEWGAAAAFPSTMRIVMHGRRAGSDAGDPVVVLRHELAHLALAEALGDRPPRWFDEGYASYAAGEWGREEILATNVALLVRGPFTFDALEDAFAGGTTRATAAYALAHRAVAELAALDPNRGLTLFFARWREGASLDAAIRSSYGITLGAFEDRWRSRTRRKYGMLALAADLTLVAGLISAVVVPVYLARRKRERKRLETLRNNEAAQEQRARESALDALLGKNSDS